MFFFLLKENWQANMPPIYLNTETKNYDCQHIDVKVLNQDNSKKPNQWGDRLLGALSRIESDYVLMMLEDFYFESPINTAEIDKCIEYMEEDSNIIAFQLVPCAEVYNNNYIKKDSGFPGFAKRKRFVDFKIIAGPTLWKKSELIKLTSKNDNPWEWEYFGSFRTWLYHKRIYCWKEKNNPIFDYDIEHGGAIHRGKWVGYKMEELTKKYNYDLDYGNREVEYDWMKNDLKEIPLPWHKRIRSILHNKSKKIYEIVRGAFLM